MLNAKPDEKYVKKQSNTTFVFQKQYKTDETGGDPTTRNFATKGERSFSKPIHIGFTHSELPW